MTDTGLKQAQQQLEFGQIVVLYELDLTSLGGSIIYFTPNAYESTVVVWNGNNYNPLNIEAEGFEWSGSSAFPTPTLRISNALFAVRAFISSFQDLVGGTLRRIRTLAKHLDGGSDPDITARFPDEYYTIDRKTQQNKIIVEWELKAAVDHFGQKLPGRQVLRDSCSQIYRVWTGAAFDYSSATCPYNGSTSYDNDNNIVAGSLDVCGKRLSNCRIRFGEFASLPFRGFPGVAKL